MKTALLILLLLPFVAHAQKKPIISKSNSALVKPNLVDSKFGFRDLRLESDISLHPEMVALSDSTNALRAYERPDDDLKVGLATLASIRYFYYHGKLQSIILRVAGELNRSQLVTALKVKYGTPLQPKGKYDGSPCIWKGRLATVFIGESDLDTESSEDVSTVLIISHKLRDKEKQDAAGDL